MGNNGSTNSGAHPGGGVPAAPGTPIALIDCGGAEGTNFASNDSVYRSSHTNTSASLSTTIKGDNEKFSQFGKSSVWSETDFSYLVVVPARGEYDVTLVFAENSQAGNGKGKRVFDVVICGSEEHTFKDVDVFAAAGMHAVHTIHIENLKVDAVIKIGLKKGKAENPFISGFIVGAVENPTPTYAAECLPTLLGPLQKVDCGGDQYGFDFDGRQFLRGKVESARLPNFEITGGNEVFNTWGKSHRYGHTDFSYLVEVPAPGEYDVTLVFCETVGGDWGVGKRRFNVAVRGMETREIKDIDVFEEVGKNAVYTIDLKNVKVNSSMVMDFMHGQSSEPFLSGYMITTAANPTAPPMLSFPGSVIAMVDVAGGSGGSDKNEQVVLNGIVQHAENKDAQITADNALMRRYGKSFRWCPVDFSYTYTVPVPAKYTVTLMFCETAEKCFGVGKRVFDCVVRGKEEHSFKDIDVFDKVGANTVYTITAENVETDSEMHIELNKGKEGDPFICGFFVSISDTIEEPQYAEIVYGSQVVDSNGHVDHDIDCGNVAKSDAPNSPSDVKKADNEM